MPESCLLHTHFSSDFNRHHEVQRLGRLGHSTFKYMVTSSTLPSPIRKCFNYLKGCFTESKHNTINSHTINYLKNDPALEQAADNLLFVLLENHDVKTAIQQATDTDAQFDASSFINYLRKDIFKAIKNESSLHTYITQTETTLKVGINMFKLLFLSIKSIPIVNYVCSPLILAIQSFNITRRLLLTRRTKKLAHSIEKLDLKHHACQALRDLSILKLKTVSNSDNRSTALKIVNLITGTLLAGLSLLTLPFTPIILPIAAITIGAISYACDFGIFAQARPARLKTKLPQFITRDFIYRTRNYFHVRPLKMCMQKMLKDAKKQEPSLIEHLIQGSKDLASMNSQHMKKMENILTNPGFINTYIRTNNAVHSMQDKRAQANRADMLQKWYPRTTSKTELKKTPETNTSSDYRNDYVILSNQLSKITNFSPNEAYLINQLFDINIKDTKYFISLTTEQKAALFFEKINTFTGKSYNAIYRMVNALS